MRNRSINIEENDDLIVYDTYVDDGFSGTDFDRPGFQRMMEDMKDKNINCIIIKDLSRLGRNHYEAGNYIEKVFPLFNIRFISINDRIDSYKDPYSVNTILVPFKNLMNDEYARDTSIKIKSSLNGMKKKGEFVGAFVSYGYVKDVNDKYKLVIDEEAAKIVRNIFEWKVKNYKIHKVKQVPEEWVTVENTHEPIIDKELFEKAQALRQVDTRVQNSGTLSMWAGILKCADCGRAMHKKYCKNTSGTVYEYYICGTYRKKSNKYCKFGQTKRKARRNY